MYQPATDDEITGLIGYLEQQLDAIRAAAYGLTEAQARETPCRSALSVSGIIKHTMHGMRGVVARVRDDAGRTFDDAAFAAYMGSFALTDTETTAGVLAEFDAARSEYIGLLASVDPDADTTEPPAPWDGIFDTRPIKMRYLLGHQIEEMARHAGHADIIREQLDGVSVPALVLTREGAPANDFFKPYAPAAGTIVS